MCLSESKRAALKLVGSVTCSTLIFSSGGRNACGSGLHSVMHAGIEIRPHAGVGVAVRAMRRSFEARNALQVRQRRHVHDRHARHAGLRHRVQQFAHAGRAVLRLLHRQRDQIVVGRIDLAWAIGGQLAGQLARVDLDRRAPALDRQAHADAVAVDRLRLGGQAHQLHLVPREQQLACEQRPVGRAHDQHIICGHLGFPLSRTAAALPAALARSLAHVGPDVNRGICRLPIIALPPAPEPRGSGLRS